MSSICALICLIRPWISLCVALALDERRVVLVRDDAAGAAQILELDGVELAADLLADDRAAGQDGDVAQHLLAPITEARRLDGQHVDHAAQLVDDERGERLAIHVLGDDQQVLAADWTSFSSVGSMSAMALIFLSVMRMYGSSRTASIRFVSVTK